MTITIKKFTLDEYLAYDDDTDARYELVDGELVAIPPESDRNNLISLYLLSKFSNFSYVGYDSSRSVDCWTREDPRLNYFNSDRYPDFSNHLCKH